MKLPGRETVGSFFKRVALTAGAGLAILLGGCDPQSIVQWAPDGAHAIVSSTDETDRHDRTFLVDGEGKIVAQAPGARAWMPDSRRVIVIRAAPATNWEEVAGLLGEERAHSAVRAADELAILIREYHGDWKKFFDQDSIKHWADANRILSGNYTNSNGDIPVGTTVPMPFFYLLEKHPDVAAPFAELLKENGSPIFAVSRTGNGAAQGTAAAKPDGAGVAPVTIDELIVRNVLPGEPAEEKLLLRSIDPIEWVRSSPNGKWIAAIIHEGERPGIYAIPVDGGDRVAVDTGAVEADWTPDSQWLVYAKTTLSYDQLESQILLGSITRSHVCDKEGRIIPKESPEDIAGVLYGKGINHVACLPDGRILFSGLDGGMPMNAQDQAMNLRLFTLRPGEANKIEGIPGDAAGNYLPTHADIFSFRGDTKQFPALGGSSTLRRRSWSLSPDGKRVAILGDNGGVAIVTLETGAVQEIQVEVEGLEKKSLANKKSMVAVIPAWRSASELSYVCPAGNPVTGPRRGEVVLRPVDGAPRAISATWTDDATDAFLMRPKEETKAE